MLTIGSIKNDGGTFPMSNITNIPTPAPPKDGQKANSGSPASKRPLSFDSLTQTLSITGETIVDLPKSGDPLLGANIKYPDFVLTAFNSESDAYVFVNQDLLNTFMLSDTTTVFQTSTMSALSRRSKRIFSGAALHTLRKIVPGRNAVTGRTVHRPER